MTVHSNIQMLNQETELIFPVRLLNGIKNLRGTGWKSLIEETTENDFDLIKKVTLTLLMAKLCGCITCNADSYRANRGCKICSQQAIRRLKISDNDLESMYKRFYIKTKKYIEKYVFDKAG